MDLLSCVSATSRRTHPFTPVPALHFLLLSAAFLPYALPPVLSVLAAPRYLTMSATFPLSYISSTSPSPLSVRASHPSSHLLSIRIACLYVFPRIILDSSTSPHLPTSHYLSVPGRVRGEKRREVCVPVVFLNFPFLVLDPPPSLLIHSLSCQCPVLPLGRCSFDFSFLPC
ncbi:hypothetical protein B0H11DRAFT_211962 [Mycena galericulata]|nr:hypothetical protein B0H11DRAFT_211962 [Mycena galericulata]